MDSHVHVSDAAGVPPLSDDPAIVALREAYFRQQPRSYLYFGVTQLLDLVSFADGPRRPSRANRCGPICFTAAPRPCSTAIRPRMLRSPCATRRSRTTCTSPRTRRSIRCRPARIEAEHTPEAVVERAAQGGARCVKIFIEDGFGASSDWPLMSKETLARVRAATRKHKLLLIAHANALDMQRIALDAGVDVLAHGLWNWSEYDGQQGMPAPIAEHLRNVHAKGIGYQPTLRVLPGTADLFRADTLKDPIYAKVVPPAVLAWYATEPGQWFKQVMREGSDGSADTKIAHGMAQAE